VIIIKVLAFDQSTVATGWCVFCDGEYVEHGLINLKKYKGTSEERISEMQFRIRELIKKEHPDYVVIEDTVLQSSPKTLKDLAQLQGVIMGICRGDNIPYSVLFPATWRKQLHFIQGRNIKRPQLKQQAKEYVMGKYGITPTEDECDAICIGTAFTILQNKE
jgi:Holliday junction resolvasome RuvABC endonuclease subunit